MVLSALSEEHPFLRTIAPRFIHILLNAVAYSGASSEEGISPRIPLKFLSVIVSSFSIRIPLSSCNYS